MHTDDWEDSADSFGPGAAKELHQNSLGLVVEGVRGKHGVGMALGNKLFEERVANGARCLLDALWTALLAGLVDTTGNICAMNVQWNCEPSTE